VYYDQEYRDVRGEEILMQSGIPVNDRFHVVP
jgi:hypothetical protein